jgi:8-amino-7-oxononanoate synthase
MDSQSPIQPLVIGNSRDTLELSARLRQKGFLVVAIRPPTVPEGTSRLRITLSAAHRFSQLDKLLDAVVESLEHD